MDQKLNPSATLAMTITKAASTQTDYTIQWLADRERIADAYRAYGYFRWVDDVLDTNINSSAEKIAFAQRQHALLQACYRGALLAELCAEEWILVDLVRSDQEKNSGLQTYLANMMDVMVFDAQRRDQIITQAELSEYSRKLATAVTEALHYFIGHNDPTPHQAGRYLAVTAAHITHMLRDTVEDIAAGYFNIPAEYLQTQGLSPRAIDSPAYQEWVYERVQLAHRYFKAGYEYLAQVKNVRCRLAGYAYTARFEWMLHRIEQDNYWLRPEYPERKSLKAAVWMGWSALASLMASPRLKTSHSD